MSDENEPSPQTGRPAAYEIRVRGHLGSAWSDWFTGLRVTLEDHGDTLLAVRSTRRRCTECCGEFAISACR